MVIGLADAGLWDAIFAVVLLLLNMRCLSKHEMNIGYILYRDEMFGKELRCLWSEGG